MQRTNMSRRNRKKNAKNAQKRRAVVAQRNISTHDAYLMPPQLYAEPRALADIVTPPQKDVVLEHIGYGTLSGAATAISKRWNPNNAYQPEVGGGTATTVGFARWATIYGFYRVVKYSYVATVSNLESFPVIGYVLNRNGDPGTSAGATEPTNPLCQQIELAPKGSGADLHHFRKVLRVAEVLGGSEVEYDSDYRAAINAAPADPVWVAIGATSGTGTNLTNGVWCKMTLRMYIRFYDYQPSTNTLKMEYLLFRSSILQKEVDDYKVMIKEAKERAMCTPPEVSWKPGLLAITEAK